MRTCIAISLGAMSLLTIMWATQLPGGNPVPDNDQSALFGGALACIPNRDCKDDVPTKTCNTQTFCLSDIQCTAGKVVCADSRLGRSCWSVVANDPVDCQPYANYFCQNKAVELFSCAVFSQKCRVSPQDLGTCIPYIKVNDCNPNT